MSLGGGNQVVPPQEGDQAVGHGLVLFGGGVTVAALVGAAGQGTDIIALLRAAEAVHRVVSLVQVIGHDAARCPDNLGLRILLAHLPHKILHGLGQRPGGPPVHRSLVPRLMTTMSAWREKSQRAVLSR